MVAGQTEPGNVSLLELRINPHDVKYGLVRDKRTGDWRTDVCTWHGLVELRWEGKSLLTVVMSNAAGSDSSDVARNKWAHLLNAGAAELIRSDMLSAFEINDVSNDLPAEVPSDALSVSLSPSASFLARFLEEHETDQLARKSFEFTKRRLVAYAKHPPSQQVPSDEPSMYAYLDNCLSAGYLDTMHAWYQEKMAGIATKMADIARRKNRSHPGFREAQDYILRNLYSFSAPRAWHQRPPTINPKKMATDADA